MLVRGSKTTGSSRFNRCRERRDRSAELRALLDGSCFMSFKEIFKSFSGRAPGRAASPKPLTREFRARVLMLCVQEHQHTDFWNEIHKKMTYRMGRPRLSAEANPC